MIFIEILRKIGTLINEQVTVTETDEIFFGDKKLMSVSRTIIGDILILWSNLGAILVYLEYLCKVFQKYRVSFWLDKWDFLTKRIKYIDHNVIGDGNFPACSKFDQINDWKLPTNGQALFSFIRLFNFYHSYAPYLETCMKPLKKSLKPFYWKTIRFMDWTLALIEIFHELKIEVTSSPVLGIFDPNKITFLDTYWSR